uniref:Uncharacterized protein n=1 Tax=Aureoumbra lagunensis TaxID=44058 RepID=A0A7S3K2R5_9STRA|eukprot:CAMPEP_0197320916 /NCGR_PEP_ID=MMETSP0891-20130614/62296_1 /TAXON_ID=44058 ORGANISM="Aureoumbra lagunensis, Strain CCMP1510" /NCGR_SAMPLE_ID=MMETSP0891 /ASSEMBLY_ACC=CAM_ASM_000534 /LENGTH=558 /DNA_ID=CAMNT_0042812515 /DNA_START=51 /DNA_END=1727 /DNA_ORIENTATION=-
MTDFTDELRYLKAQNDALLNRVRRLRQLEEAEALATLDDEYFEDNDDLLLREAEAVLRDKEFRRQDTKRRRDTENSERMLLSSSSSYMSNNQGETKRDMSTEKAQRLQRLVLKLFVDRYQARESVGLERYALSRAVKTALLAASVTAWRRAINAIPIEDSSTALLSARAELERAKQALSTAYETQAQERRMRERAERLAQEEQMQRKAQEDALRRIVEDLALERRRRLEAETAMAEAMNEAEAQADKRREAEIQALEAASQLKSRELVCREALRRLELFTLSKNKHSTTKKKFNTKYDDDVSIKDLEEEEANSVLDEAAVVRRRVEGLLDKMRDQQSTDRAQWEIERERLAEIQAMSIEEQRSTWLAEIEKRDEHFAVKLAQVSTDLEARLDRACALHAADVERFRAEVDSLTQNLERSRALEDNVKRHAVNQRIHVLCHELQVAKTALNASESAIRAAHEAHHQDHYRVKNAMLRIVVKWLATPPLRRTFATWRHFVQADYRAHVLRLIKSHVSHLKHKMIAINTGAADNQKDQAAILASLHEAADLLHATLRRRVS